MPPQRKKGAGRPSCDTMAAMSRCASCKKEVTVEGKVGRRDTCPHCGSDLHSCLNCEFYDEGAYNQCRETEAERVTDKEKSNFCDYFRLKK